MEWGDTRSTRNYCYLTRPVRDWIDMWGSVTCAYRITNGFVEAIRSFWRNNLQTLVIIELHVRSPGYPYAFGECMKSLIAAFSVTLALFATLALSAEIPFDQAQFDAARAAGKPVAVVFHADDQHAHWAYLEQPSTRPRPPSVLRRCAGAGATFTVHPSFLFARRACHASVCSIPD